MTKPLLAAAAFLVPALALGGTTTWSIDPAHSHTSFTVRHMVISNVRGEFGKMTGTVTLDDGDVRRSSVEATIDAATVDTRVSERDAHLRSADFLDVANHPTITFRSRRVERARDGTLKVAGDLTIRGVTRPVVLDVTGPTAEVTDPWGKARRGFSAMTRISRRDFGLLWNKMVEAGPVVGDEVRVEIEAELVKELGPKQAER